jgi:myo-inositol-1(or 4)-monophosphatase
VREAGGFVSTADGRDDVVDGGSILAGNEYVHREMLAALKAAR